MAADISAVTYFAPIAAFLIVFIVGYAIFAKTKILGDNKFVLIFVSLLIAVLFVSAAGVRTYIQTVVPWVAVLFLSLVFILALTHLFGKPGEAMHRGIAVTTVIVFGLIFLLSAFFIFSWFIVGYLPGPFFGTNADPQITFFLSWLYSPRVAGAVLLVIISAAVAWVLVRAK